MRRAPAAPAIPSRVLGYARVSGREQGAHGTSLEEQRETIERYCAAYGWPKPILRTEVESAGEEKLERRVELAALVRDAIDAPPEPGLFSGDPNAGTYSNRGPEKPLTIADLEATRCKLEALPRGPSDITVSPDLELFVRTATGPLGPRIHVDERLPHRTWHEGKPRKAPDPRIINDGPDSEFYFRTRKIQIVYVCPACPFKSGAEGKHIPEPDIPQELRTLTDWQQIALARKEAGAFARSSHVARAKYDAHRCQGEVPTPAAPARG